MIYIKLKIIHFIQIHNTNFMTIEHRILAVIIIACIINGNIYIIYKQYNYNYYMYEYNTEILPKLSL